MIDKYKYTNIQVVQADIRERDDLLQAADVLIFNNVFEHFGSCEVQMKCWDVVFGSVRRQGQLIVTIPSLSDSLELLGAGMPEGWVREVEWECDEELVPDECDVDVVRLIHMYEVL